MDEQLDDNIANEDDNEHNIFSSSIDYDRIDDKLRRTVRVIEAKPHIRYIRYLITKRYSPVVIKKELYKLALSAPHEPNIIAYYTSVIDPIVRKHGLGQLYGDYKNKMLRGINGAASPYAKDILNYSLDIGNDSDLEIRFQKFLKELEVDSLWIKEILRYYGSASRFPLDENGNRILVGSIIKAHCYETILVHPKRHIIDKMILEGVAETRIAKYCTEKLKLALMFRDIVSYKKIFFNIKSRTLEEKLKVLEVERNSLNVFISDLLKTSLADEIEIGDRVNLRKRAEDRVLELDENIKALNMVYSNIASQVGINDADDFESIFTDIMARGYKRYVELDSYKDRDVVDPMFKIAKMVTLAHDKLESMKSGHGNNFMDQHSQTQIVELYKKRVEEVMEEQMERANRELIEAGIEPIDEDLIPEQILGIEDLGFNMDVKEKDEKK